MLLETVRILDLSGGDADAVTRLLADLGADVLKVEPPGGSPARTAAPLLGGVSIAFALHNANKRSVTLDPADETDRRRFDELAGAADIVVDGGGPGRSADFGTSLFGTSCAELADRFEHLVTMSVTDFGSSGPRSRWRATDAVLYALSGALSRSGPTTGTPVLPPDGIASATAAVQAAWAVLVAYYNRLRCGAGDYIDFSRFDAVVTVLDPIFGAHGQVAAARRGASRWRGRPRNQDAYPIYPCRDGYVRLCVMSPRQWRGLWAWLGEPAEYADPKFGVIGERFAVWPQISVLVRELFAGQDRADLVAAGQARGVPIAGVGDPARVLAGEHLAAAGAVTRTELAPGLPALIPTGYYVVDDQRAGFRTAAPAHGEACTGWRDRPPAGPALGGAVGARPFEGVRIVDLGVIVAGGEASRLFGDLGAEIIKVESAAYPDGLRQARAGSAMSESFAWTHRNNSGFGLDLRSRAGKEIFGRLVGTADAVLANFKPGTLTALGFSYDALRGLNPGVVLAESSAFGETGPWSDRMGYGPLVRATTGVTALWTTPEGPETNHTGRHSFYDATTVFPDHVVARVTAIGALAALIAGRRTGAGAHVHVSQAEVAVNQLDTCYVARTAGTAVQPDTAVDLVCPCSGDDEWCVVSIHTDDDWCRVAAAFDDAGLASDPRFTSGAARAAHRAELVEQLSRHTHEHTPAGVGELLQAAGVAAAPMNRPPDIAEDPQLAHRAVFAEMTHPLIEHPLPAETGPAPFRNIPRAPQRPAPLPGQDTRAVCRGVLGLDEDETERLIADGVLFTGGSARLDGGEAKLVQRGSTEERRSWDRPMGPPISVTPMPVDPRTPVLIGYGQINHPEGSEPVEPVDLMAAAARLAADDRVLRAVDSIRVVNLLSARYRDPGLLLAQRIGADRPATRYSPMGGNVPQSLMNRACLDIQDGRAGVVLLAGGEMWRTRTRLRAAGGKLAWTRQDDTVVPMAECEGADVPLSGAAEERIGLDRPAYVYPLFEQALRLAAGETVDGHRQRIGELWSRFNAVAVDNPHAWIRRPVGAEQIWQPGPKNRMISWPYTKLMNSNNMVDQAAALVLTSVRVATELRIPSERWVFPQAGADAHDTYAIGARHELHRSPAIRIAGACALELAGAEDIAEIDYLDLYSCFPSAVQVAANELGLPTDAPDRPLTVTGGLTFAGGPWNNYVTHSIATLAELLVANPGRRGLITANGGYLTKHSVGVYSTEPPASGFRWQDVQAAVDAQPTRPAVAQWQGTGAVESWTTPFDRDGRPQQVFLAVRTPEGARNLAVIRDPEIAESSVREDIAGATVDVHGDGTAALR